MYNQTWIKRSPLRQKKWPYKTGDLLKEVQCTWNVLWQNKKILPLNTGDCLTEMNTCTGLTIFHGKGTGIIYRKTAILKVETIIIATIISESERTSRDICDNVCWGLMNRPNIFVYQGQFNDSDFISDTHQRENIKFSIKFIFWQQKF